LYKQKKSICAPYIKHCLTLHFPMTTVKADRIAYLNKFIKKMFKAGPIFSSGTPTTANSISDDSMFKVTKGSIVSIPPSEVSKGFNMNKVSIDDVASPNSNILFNYVIPQFFLTEKGESVQVSEEDKKRIAAFIVLSTIDDGEAFRKGKKQEKLHSYSAIVKSLEGGWEDIDYRAEAKQEKKELVDYFNVVFAAIEDATENTEVEPSIVNTAVSVRKAFNVALVNFLQNTSCNMKVKFPSAGSGASGSRTLTLGKFSVFKVATNKDVSVLKGITENALSSTKTSSGNVKPNPINGGYTWAVFTAGTKTIVVGSPSKTYSQKTTKKLLKGKIAKAEFDHTFYTSKASSSIQRRATKKTSAKLPGEDAEVNPGKLRAIFLAMMSSQ